MTLCCFQGYKPYVGNQFSALAKACEYSSLPMLKLLIDSGAKLTTPLPPERKNVLELVHRDEVMQYLTQVCGTTTHNNNYHNEDESDFVSHKTAYRFWKSLTHTHK